ncbi:MAG: hypothetical protein OXC14_17920 [Rhodospirillaceae bacterium]|nr:hypothetical protein [Rhodospirillaceae bacterium]
MALDRQIARLSKILVDSEKISFDEAQARLRSLTLEVVVGAGAFSPAAHAAALTAVSVGSRTFVGGVRLTGAVHGRAITHLPLRAESLAEAAHLVGTSEFEGTASRRIVIGMDDAGAGWAVSPWWTGWSAGTAKPSEARPVKGDNPLPGIAAGAMAVGVAFEAERSQFVDFTGQVDLWPVGAGQVAPRFQETFLPGALWLVGLGNLGQAYLWALSALPFADPGSVSLVLQDRDSISEENWATSVLVKAETYGALKTKVAEDWASAKGFRVRRIDRWLTARDRVEDDDPRLALSGVDKVSTRQLMAKFGFDCIVDGGLGRTATDFDRYRVTVFDKNRSIDHHFAGLADAPARQEPPNDDAYRCLEREVGACGAAEVGGASVAVPYVSAVAGAIVVARVIAITSGCECVVNEVGILSHMADRKVAELSATEGRGIGHAGKPAVEVSENGQRLTLRESL